MKCKYCKDEMDVEGTNTDEDIIEVEFECHQCDIKVIAKYKLAEKPTTKYYNYLGYEITKEEYEKELRKQK